MAGSAHIRMSACVLLVASLLVASPVVAAPSAKEDARGRLEAGVQLLDAGDFAAALLKFQEAYTLYASPKLLFNMGLAYKGLGKNALAFMAFEKFLAEAADGTPSQHLDHARQELERLSKRVAFVYLSSDVPVADVSIDGTSLGSATLPRRFPVDTGPHKLQLTAGSQSRVHQFSAVAGESVNANLSLSPAAATSPPPVAGTDSKIVTKPSPREGDAGPEGIKFDIANAGRQPERRAWLPTARWATLGGAVAALGIGFLSYSKAGSKRQEFDNNSPDRCLANGDNVVSGPPTCYSLADDFRNQRRNASIAYAAAGTLAAASIVLFLMNEDVPPRAAFLPGTPSTPTGVSYAGRF